MATTDLDGRFAFNVRTGTTLKFSMVGIKPQTLKVKNQKYVELTLEEDDINLGEVVVQTKRITDRIMPEPTDIEVKGNYFHVRTRVRVPREMFSHNTRLVVQPVLNNATRGELKAMRPMVYDAREYNRTQDRLYSFNMADTTAGDPLARYVTVKSKQTREKGRTNDIIGYADSIYVEHVKDEFSCDVYMAIENYNRILYRDTTIIARGTVNPLRWLDYRQMDVQRRRPAERGRGGEAASADRPHSATERRHASVARHDRLLVARWQICLDPQARTEAHKRCAEPHARRGAREPAPRHDVLV